MGWLSSKLNREILASVGVGAAALAGATWTVFVYFYPTPAALSPAPLIEAEPAVTAQVKVTICIGAKSASCPKGSQFYSCGTKLAAVVAKQCGDLKTSMRTISRRSGHQCGYIISEVTCIASSQ